MARSFHTDRFVRSTANCGILTFLLELFLEWQRPSLMNDIQNCQNKKKDNIFLAMTTYLCRPDCSHPLRSGVLREGRYAPFSNTSRPWLVVSPGRELFAPCGEKDPPTHACLLRNLPKKVVCAKTSTFQLRKMVTHLHAADAQPLAELAPRRMRLSCRLSVRALGESYDSLPLPKQRPAC